MPLQSKYLNLEGTVDRTTISRSVIYRLMKEADFPRPYSIKGIEKRVVWAVEELDDWMQKNLTKQAA